MSPKHAHRQYAQWEKPAARHGQMLSDAGPEAEAILSEILALRKIVIKLLYGDKAGEPLSKRPMREMIEAAERGEVAKALERLAVLKR